jgi:hypothetical protein
MILKQMALTAFVAFGAVQSTTAMMADDLQAVDEMPYGRLKVTAKHWRQQVEHPEMVVPALANTDLLEVSRAARTGSLDEFATHYAVAAGNALEYYINTNLLPGAPGTAMLAPTTANREDAANDVNVHALITNVPHVPGGGPFAAGYKDYNAAGGWGAAGGNHVENEMPADPTKGEFIAALKNRMNQIPAARLANLAHGGAFAPIPAHLSSENVTATKHNIRDAVKGEILTYLNLLNTGGAAADIFVAAVANAAGGVGLANANLAGAGATVPGICNSAAAAPVAAPHPANLTVAGVAAAFDAVIDEVNLF